TLRPRCKRFTVCEQSRREVASGVFVDYCGDSSSLSWEKFMTRVCGWVAVAWLISGVAAGAEDTIATAIARIKSVGKEGANNREAAAAWKHLVQHGPAILTTLLAALDDADAAAANWLRTAIDAIAERE